jgi:hypothetical protein
MISEHITKKTAFDTNTVIDIFTNLATFTNKGEYKGIIKNNTTASTNP